MCVCVLAFQITLCVLVHECVQGRLVEDVLHSQRFITFTFLTTLPELLLPFLLQLSLSGQCDQSVPPCALCKHVPACS